MIMERMLMSEFGMGQLVYASANGGALVGRIEGIERVRLGSSEVSPSCGALVFSRIALHRTALRTALQSSHSRRVRVSTLHHPLLSLGSAE